MGEKTAECDDRDYRIADVNERLQTLRDEKDNMKFLSDSVDNFNLEIIHSRDRKNKIIDGLKTTVWDLQRKIEDVTEETKLIESENTKSLKSSPENWLLEETDLGLCV